jgi:hypothetical protein
MKRNGFAGIGSTRGIIQEQSIRFRVVSENLSISSPIQGAFDLALHIFSGKVLVENVPEEFQGYRPV